jgi:hypothetical protein
MGEFLLSPTQKTVGELLEGLIPQIALYVGVGMWLEVALCLSPANYLSGFLSHHYCKLHSIKIIGYNVKMFYTSY